MILFETFYGYRGLYYNYVKYKFDEYHRYDGPACLGPRSKYFLIKGQDKKRINNQNKQIYQKRFINDII